MTSLDPRRRFGVVAEQYRRGRPSYPPELIDWILAQAGLEARVDAPAVSPPTRIADVGCGTGIATRLFAERGFDVVGIDPSDEMLDAARTAGGTARYAAGEAAATGLAPASVELVVVAQALHWFDLPAACAEFRRILRSGGCCAAFWNERGRSPFMDDYEQVLFRYSSEYTGRSRAAKTAAAVRETPGVVEFRVGRFAYRQPLERGAFLDRVHSSSYVAHGVEDRAGFGGALEALFDRHQRQGSVEFAYQTLGIVFYLTELTEVS